MALSLTYNGAPTTTITGSPANADRISMSNGTLRLSFTWNNHVAGCWCVDLVEWSSDGGTTWITAFYGRDAPHFAVSGAEQTPASSTLSILTNTASQLTLQLQASKVVSSVTYTHTSKWTMTTAQPNVECSQYLATSAQVALGSGNFIEDWGSNVWFTGLDGSCLALFQGMVSPYDAHRCNQLLYTGDKKLSRVINKGGNSSGRGYSNGYSCYLSNGLLCAFVISPTSNKNLLVNVLDAGNGSQQAALDAIYAFRGYDQYFNGIDNAYHNVSDFAPSYWRVGTCFGSFGGATTYPQATSNTDATTTLNITWSLAIEKPATGNGSGTLPIPRWMLPQSINKWMDILYPRPNVGGAGILGGGTGPMWQPLATQEATVLPLLSSTYTTYFDTTYGYWLFNTSATWRESYCAAIALRCLLRYNNLGVPGNGDTVAAMDQLAKILANYQTQNGSQAGAIQKIRHTDTNNFTCEDTTHANNNDQPHVSMYTMAEALSALIDYYRVRGNQTLAATYGNITVAALLDAAMAYLVKVQQPDGGWLVEYNNVNTVTNANARIGASWSGSSTPDLAASLLRWSQLSPTATTAQKASWQSAATHGADYWLYSESTAHGNYEFGEDYVNHSSHAMETILRGLFRLYRLTEASIYLEHAIYYAEIGYLLCKKVDDVINNSGTANKDLHSGGLISTIDWNGQITGESGPVWSPILTDVLMLHPGLLSYHYFYAWAALCHQTWGYRDVATYSTSYPMAQAYISPGTGFAGTPQGVDNTRFLKHAPGAALHLLPTHTLAACDNPNVFSSCIEASFASDTPVGRTILLYNPQNSSQVVNLTIKGQSTKVIRRDGALITGTISGSDVTINFTLTAGQISTVTAR